MLVKAGAFCVWSFIMKWVRFSMRRRRSGRSEWVYCWARELVDGDFIDFRSVLELPSIHSGSTYPGPYQLGRRRVKSVNLSVRRPKRLDVPIWSQMLPKQEDAYRLLCPLTYIKKRGGLATSRSEQISLNIVPLLKQFYPYSISPGKPKIEQGGREQAPSAEYYLPIVKLEIVFLKIRIWEASE